MIEVFAHHDDLRIIAQCSRRERLYDLVDRFPGTLLLFASELKVDLQVLTRKLDLAGSRASVILENDEQPHSFQSSAIHGIIYRSAAGATLIDCLRRVANGEHFQQTPEIRIETQERNSVAAHIHNRLTPKEMKIIALLMQGCKNKEISVRLGTKEQAVKNYLRRIFDKTGVSDRLELALFALQHRNLLAAASGATDLIPRTS